MKRKPDFQLFAAIFVTCILLVSTVTSRVTAATQDEEEVKTREEVAVVNIEVPVRVFNQGESVDNLTKDDFIIYEGKEEQEINAFYKLKKKIAFTLEPGTSEKQKKTAPAPRYFVLVFRISEYNKELKAGLATVFKDILRENDQLLVFANNKTVFLENLHDKQQAYELIDRTLREQSLETRHLMTTNLLKIKQLLDQAKLEFGGDGLGSSLISTEDANHLLEFLNRYLLAWKEYKRRYLVPNMDKYYNFARFLEKIQMEKWVISFYQVEMFPRLKLSGNFRRTIDQTLNAWLMGRSEDAAYARKIMAQLSLIDRELSAAENFPAEQVSQLFYKVGATFHSIFSTISKETNVRDLEFKSLSTDIENSLREITAKTGGELIATNNLVSALGKVVEKEDICYMLTYAPANPDHVGKIRVELVNKEYKKFHVIYDENMRADYINEYLARKRAEDPVVQLTKVNFEKKKLDLVIDDFFVKEVKKNNIGRLRVHVLVKDTENQTLFDKSKDIEAVKNQVTLSLDFGWLKVGEYNVVVEVDDLLTGKTASRLLQPKIN